MNERFIVSVLRFDLKADELIRNAVTRIQRLLGNDGSAAYAPHISLIPTDFEDRAELATRVRNLVSAQRAFEVTFSHLGFFKGGVIFLGVTATDSLLAFHQGCFQASSPSPQTPWIGLYQPGSWVAHRTLVMEVPDERIGSILAEVNSCLALPITAMCQSVNLLEVDDGNIRVLDTMHFQAI